MAGSQDEIIYRFGEFELFPRERMLLREGERVSLTPRMFDLLRVLVESDGHLLRKEALLEKVWADAAVEEGNLNRTISALRKALGENRNEIRFIETVPKAGYRFIAKVDRSNAVPAAESDPPAEIVGREAPPVNAPVRAGKFPVAAVAAVGAFILLFGVLTLSYLLIAGRDEKTTAQPQSSGPVRLTNNEFDEDAASWTHDDKIRFIRFAAVNRVESMIMNADGTDQRRSGAEVRDLRSGSWSPDGKRVIFAKVGESARSLYIANVDGSDERPVGFAIGPMDWSPDGSQIVYNTAFPTESDDSEIVVYTIATGERKNISNHPAFDANPSFSPDGKQVIFNSDRDGNSEIYLMNADGTGLRRLTSHPAKEAFQSFSPDGTQIVFNSTRDNEKVGIFLLNVNDDSEPRKLSDTRHNAEIRPGCWSRDGTRLVYMSDAGGEKMNIYSMEVEPFGVESVLQPEGFEIKSVAESPQGGTFALAVKRDDGRGELRLFDELSGTGRLLLATENFDLFPSWSPDGRSLVLAKKEGGNTEVFSVSSDGTNLKNLTNSDARDAAPVWSPDGTRIVFSTDRDNRSETTRLYSINADGSEPRSLMPRHGYEMTPSWSADGQWIAFAGDRADGSSQSLDIYVVNSADPANERIVASRRFHDANPSFSPDGKRLVFASQGDGNFEIYLVNLDGTGLVRLTRNKAEDTMPVFSRDGKKIYFVSNRAGKFGLYQMTAP